MRDAKYYQDAIELLGESLKTCRPENRGCLTKAIIFAKRRLRLIRFGCAVLLVLSLSSCGAVKGFGKDLQDLSDVTREYVGKS